MPSVKPVISPRSSADEDPENASSTQAIQSRSLAREIVGIIQGDIIAGRYPPGQHLPERELVKRFGVSSIPVREALLELENRGLVTRRHNRGCSVIRLTPREAARICELRRVLEPKVVEWAAARVTTASAAALKRQLIRVEEAAATRDWARYFQEDLTFHRMLWEVADNGYAARALETVLGSLFASGLMGSRDAASIDLLAEVEKHRRLLNAVCDRDGQRASLCLLEIAAGFEKHLD